MKKAFHILLIFAILTIGASENSIATPSDCLIKSSTSDPFPVAFPRPISSQLGEQKISIFLIPYQYSDIPFTARDYEDSASNLEQVKKFIEINSYGKVNIDYKLAEISNVVTLPGKSDVLTYSNQYFTENANFQAVDSVITRVLNNYKGPEDLKNFTVILIFSPYFPANGLGFGGRPEGYETNKGLIKRTILQFGELANNPALTIHEMHHSLFSLPDLYDHAAATVGKPKYLATAGWGLMSNLGNYGKNDFGWEKYLNGWIDSEQVVCLASTTKIKIALTPQASDSAGTKLIVIKLSDYQALAVEFRIPGIAYDGMNVKKGALIYLIDGSLGSGKNPIKVLTKPDITTLKDKQTLIYKKIKITQLSSIGDNLKLQIN